MVYNARIKLYDGVPTQEIDEALIKSARGLIEQEPTYRFVAAGLLRGTIYKDIPKYPYDLVFVDGPNQGNNKTGRMCNMDFKDILRILSLSIFICMYN